MEKDIERVRVVLVSPGDVAEERELVEWVVEELNRGVATGRGCWLSLWRWETDARPGMHLEGPQGLIDELMDIDEADLVLGVFWKRFGTPTGAADSGTEHELRRAWAAWMEHRRPEVMVYFCTRAYSPKTSSEAQQGERVRKFRGELPKEQLSWTYETPREFERLAREHLTRWLLDRPPALEPRATQPEGRRVRFNLPTVAPSFAGRGGELEALDDALGVADRAVITQAITGLGGVGKSQLAARYVQQRADRYDVVAWIRAEDGGVADFASLAARLGEPVEGLSPSDRAQLALDWLTDSEQHWLLVLDNIESPEQLERCRPRGGGGRVLVTSRDRAVSQFGPMLAVDVFEEDTAIAYLTDRAGRRDDEDAARELARALGCLPLALSHAAAYCQTGTRFADYRELLGELPARELFDSHPEVSYAQTVASTWKTSIDAANNEAPLAGDVLEMAAHLAPDAIPKYLFHGLVDVESAPGRKRLADAFNALARFSLATVDDTTVSVHRLLQKTIRDDTVDRGDQTASLRALIAVADAFPRDTNVPALWPRCERLLPHALTLAETLSRPGDAGPRLIGLLNAACSYLNHAEPGRRGLATSQRTLAHAERILGTEHPATLQSRDNLALAHLWAGRFAEAIAIFEPLLADRARIHGADHDATLTTRNNLGLAYKSAGRTPEAIEIYEPLRAYQERILGAEHSVTLNTRHNLADAYRDAGRIAEAIAIYEPVLAGRKRILGAEHPHTLITRNNLGFAYRSAGRIAEAIKIYEPLLADRERILGTEHAHTLTTRLNLARAYRTAGRIGEAILIYEPLLADSERILGAEHSLPLATRNNLAHAYQAAGRIEEAIAIYERALADRERILGAEHPDTLTTRHNVAGAYLEVGRIAEAIEVYQLVHAGRQRVLGAEHPDTLTAHHNVAGAYRAAGRLAEAIAIYEPLVAEHERIFGVEHPETLTTRHSVAGAYKAAGRIEEAIAIYERVLADRERILGPEHPDTLKARNNLASAYKAAGRDIRASARQHAERTDEAARVSRTGSHGHRVRWIRW